MRELRGILIDPVDRSIKEVTLPGNASDEWRHIAKLIDCAYITRTPLTHEDMLWVDDEGLLVQPNPNGYFTIYGHLLAGKGLILGTGNHEDSVSTKLSLPHAVAVVRFVDYDEVKGSDAIEPKMTFTTFDELGRPEQTIDITPPVRKDD